MGKSALLLSILLFFVSSTHAQTTATTSTEAVPQLLPAPPMPKAKKKKSATLAPTGAAQVPMLNLPSTATTIPSMPVVQEITPADVVSKISEGNQAMQKFKEQNDRCAICELNEKYQFAGDGNQRASELVQMKKNFDASAGKEGALTEPKRDDNTTNTWTAICGTRTGDYDACIFNGDVVPGKFKFNDTTKNPRREWEFDFPSQARQDLGFSISDADDEHVSKSKETYMMVFPRRYLPSIRIEGDKQIVTLPTGETVTYDAKTKKVLSGAINDSKTYTGTGVVIRVDRTGEEPRLGGTTATISKGGKSCKVPSKNLWPDQSSNSMLHFKYASDEAFDTFLKQTCGFSIFN